MFCISNYKAAMVFSTFHYIFKHQILRLLNQTCYRWGVWQFFLINNDKRRQREYCFMVQMYSKANIFYETLNLDTHPHTHHTHTTHTHTHTHIQQALLLLTTTKLALNKKMNSKRNLSFPSICTFDVILTQLPSK